MDGGPPVVSICIVSYEAPDYLRRCLDSIRALTHLPYETIIVDNASGPAMRAYLASLDDVQVILNEENRLWCPAMNQALRAATPGTPYLLLLNPDVEVLRSDWLDRMVAALRPGIGMVGTEHNFRPIGPTFGALDGSCLLVRREVFEDPDIGLLDERLPWNGSPYVLTARAWREGWGYRCMPPRPRLIVHHGGKSREASVTPVLNQAIDHRAISVESGLQPTRPRYARRLLVRQAIRIAWPWRPPSSAP